jgi:hypothetical protein
VHEELPPKPKEKKEKRGIIGGLLSKKSKTESKGTAKELKEEVHTTAVEEEVLYVQLESFSEVVVPT